MLVGSLLVVALAAGCADEDSVRDGPTSGVGGGSAMGPGLSVAQARASRLNEPLLVTGYVVAEGARVRLCDALAESFPPQCGGASLEVRGIDLSAFGGLETSGGVRWSAQPRQLLGEVKNGVIAVSSTSKG